LIKKHSDIFRTENINKSFLNKKVLENFSFSILQNDTLGIVGKNGAGKTTLLKLLTGLSMVDSGKIYFDESEQCSINFKKKIGFYLGSEFLPTELTGRQYLNFLNHIYLDDTRTKVEIEEIFTYFFDDIHSIDKQIGNYSLGMAQKIGICGAIIHNPEILILDEPFTGLDAFSSYSLINFLNLYKEKNTLIISSHDLNYLEKVCNKLLLIDSGHIEYYGLLEGFTKGGLNTLEEVVIKSYVDVTKQIKNVTWL
jgi:ABC-type multidrug transport system ATPase subunit